MELLVVVTTLDFGEEKWDLEMYRDGYEELLTHFGSKGSMHKNVCYPITVTDTSNNQITFDLMELKRITGNKLSRTTLVPHSIVYFGQENIIVDGGEDYFDE